MFSISFGDHIMERKVERFIYQLRRVKLSEIVDAWKLPIAVIASFFYKCRHRDMWIICEDANEARDNGYWLFKYIRTKHPNQECVYAIRNSSPDYNKVATIGETVEYGSLKHWIQYLAASKKISSQKAGNPNAAIFYFLEVYGFLKDKRVFLQHGVIKDDLKWLYYEVTRMDRFICGAFPEYKYVRDTFGYPDGHVCYTGLCRFDGWHCSNGNEQKMILIMPTWREWIADEDYRLAEYEGTTEIPKTNYFRNWIDFLADDRLTEISRENNVEFVFYPHRNMQKYMEFFPASNNYVKIMSAEDADIQDLLRRASMMITDYSSVFFDIIYMKKPVLFYQFDYEQFRKGQYREGYFDYSNNPFGKSYRDKQDVFNAIKKQIDVSFTVNEQFLSAHAEYFPLYDTNNCERVYKVVSEL